MLTFSMEQLMSEEEAWTLVVCHALCCDTRSLVIMHVQGLRLGEGKEIAQGLVAS